MHQRLIHETRIRLHQLDLPIEQIGASPFAGFGADGQVPRAQ
jgi:hypothetical protein